VLNVTQVDKAIDAGAQFTVSPGFNPQVVSPCLERGIPITPGCILNLTHKNGKGYLAEHRRLLFEFLV
jgi:2-keto-3-deoxy-6-phosphogluconate aldolase